MPSKMDSELTVVSVWLFWNDVHLHNCVHFQIYSNLALLKAMAFPEIKVISYMLTVFFLRPALSPWVIICDDHLLKCLKVGIFEYFFWLCNFYSNMSNNSINCALKFNIEYCTIFVDDFVVFFFSSGFVSECIKYLPWNIKQRKLEISQQKIMCVCVCVFLR